MSKPDGESVRPPADVDRPAYQSTGAILLFVIPFAILLAGDLSLKAWAFAGAKPPEPSSLNVPHGGTVLIPKVLALRLTWNPGAIFGSMQGRRWFFVVASVAAAGLILYFFVQSRANERVTHIGLSLILAGAMGNLFDRLSFGFVRDMLLLFPDVPLPFGWHWPGSGLDQLYPWIFNPADVYLLIGIGLVLIRSMFTHPPKPDVSPERPGKLGP